MNNQRADDLFIGEHLKNMAFILEGIGQDNEMIRMHVNALADVAKEDNDRCINILEERKGK